MDVKRAKSGYEIVPEAVEIPEKMAREAVSNVFLTLCGQADKEDRYTGMQREMSSTMVQAVRAAYAAGYRVALQEAKRADNTKHRIAEKHALDAKKWLEDMLAAAKKQLDSMCMKVEEQNRQVCRIKNCRVSMCCC